MKWKCLDSGRKSAAENMALDQRLLDALDPSDEPLLHLYDWEGDCATYGYFVKPDRYLDLAAAERYGVSLAQRPTGGGIIFHTTDLAFSVLVPAGHPAYSLNTLDNYAFVNRIVLKAVEQFLGRPLVAELLPMEMPQKGTSCCNFCMAKPTQYDVMVGGRKVGGAAQRRTKAGFLHQGSIALGIPNVALLQALLRDRAVFEAMQENSFSLLGSGFNFGQLQEARHQLRNLLLRLCQT